MAELVPALPKSHHKSRSLPMVSQQFTVGRTASSFKPEVHVRHNQRAKIKREAYLLLAGRAGLGKTVLSDLAIRALDGINVQFGVTLSTHEVVLSYFAQDIVQFSPKADWKEFADATILNLRNEAEMLSSKPNEEFLPSDELIRILDRSMSKIALELENGTVPNRFQEFFDRSSSALRKDVLAQELRALIASVGFRVVDGKEENRPLTRDGEFNSFFLSAFLDLFPIFITDIGVFQSKLLSELISFLRAGGEYSGSWGKLRVSPTGDLLLIDASNTFEALPKLGRPRAKKMAL